MTESNIPSAIAAAITDSAEAAYKRAQDDYESAKAKLMTATLEHERTTLAVEVAAVKLKVAHTKFLQEIAKI